MTQKKIHLLVNRVPIISVCNDLSLYFAVLKLNYSIPSSNVSFATVVAYPSYSNMSHPIFFLPPPPITILCKISGRADYRRYNINIINGTYFGRSRAYASLIIQQRSRLRSTRQQVFAAVAAAAVGPIDTLPGRGVDGGAVRGVH